MCANVLCRRLLIEPAIRIIPTLLILVKQWLLLYENFSIDVLISLIHLIDRCPALEDMPRQ